MSPREYVYSSKSRPMRDASWTRRTSIGSLGLAAAAKVRADRRELFVRERRVVEQDAKSHRLDRRRVREARARRGVDDLGREAREPRELEVRRDALLARDPEAKVPLDAARSARRSAPAPGPRRAPAARARAPRARRAAPRRGSSRRGGPWARTAEADFTLSHAVAMREPWQGWRACRSGLFV